YTLLTLPVFFIGIQYGVEGACWAWLAINLISFSIHLKVMLPTFQLKLTSFLGALLPGFCSAVIMLAGLMLLRHYLTGQMHEALLMFLMILMGAILFAAAQWLLFRRQLLITLRYLRH
nr:hypothetical protein [Endozoicomonas sp.]